jgi:carbon monoxide dehydrogenase subunit G
VNISGDVEFKLPVEKMWNALHDTEVLKKVIPGCESLTQEENGEYSVKLKLGVAAVKGNYTGKIKLDDIEENKYFILKAEGSGTPGHVDVTMHCKLFPTDKGCRLDWNCDAEVGGMIAGVGSRVLGGISKFMANKFFKDIQKELL